MFSLTFISPLRHRGIFKIRFAVQKVIRFSFITVIVCVCREKVRTCEGGRALHACIRARVCVCGVRMKDALSVAGRPVSGPDVVLTVSWWLQMWSSCAQSCPRPLTPPSSSSCEAWTVRASRCAPSQKALWCSPG